MATITEKLTEVLDNAIKSPDDTRNLGYFRDLLKEVSHLSELMYAEAGKFNILQEAANSGLAKYVQCLLDEFPNLNPNWASEETPPPIFLALNDSHVEVVRTFIEHKVAHPEPSSTNTVAFDCIDINEGRNIFHSLPFHKHDSQSIQTAEELMEITNTKIRDELMNVINTRDHEGYTALDYAVYSSTESYVKILLQFGASLAHHGNEDVITKISPEIIEHVLNTNCLQLEDLEVNRRDSKIYKQLGGNLKITANFDFLAPTDKQMGTESGKKYLLEIKQK